MTSHPIFLILPIIAVVLGVIPITVFAQSDNQHQPQTGPDGSQPDSQR